jgi:hypothetical protein
MATPFITGVVALMLEREPTLDPGQVKNLLRAHSRIPRRPAETFDPKWGYGLIDLSRMTGTFRPQQTADVEVNLDSEMVVFGGIRVPIRREWGRE